MKVSRDFGIVVRRAALAAKNVDLSTVMVEFNFREYFDESDSLLSLGPFFGGDAADECTKSLERLGLTYIDDFLSLSSLCPPGVRSKYFDVSVDIELPRLNPHPKAVARRCSLDRRHRPN